MSVYEETVGLAREDGVTVPAIRFTPDGDAAERCNGAGVLVVAGEWGLQPEVRERIALPLAEFGYVVVATDLMHGHLATSAEQAQVRAEGIDAASAIEDIAAGLLNLKEMAGGKLGVIALDRAATVALEAATTLPQIDAVVALGGGLPGADVKLSRLRAAVLVTRTLSGAMTKTAYEVLIGRMKRSKAQLSGHDYASGERFVVAPASDDERHEATMALDRIRDFLTFNLT